MISSTHRFHGTRSLNDVYKRGQMARGPFFAVKLLPNPRLKSYRAAVVVSRKVHKSAVVRNRIRRRLYALIRGAMHGGDQSYAIVVTVYSAELAAEPHQKLELQLKKQLSEAGYKTQAKQ